MDIGFYGILLGGAEVGLELGLEVVVGEILALLLAVIAEERGELVVGDDLTAIVGVLEVVLLDVGADVLGDIDTRAELSIIPAGELGKILGDLDGLHETRVGRAGLVGALDLGDTVDISTKSLEVLGNRAGETESIELGLTLSREGGDSILNEGLKSIKILLNGLLGDNTALALGGLLSLSGSLGNGSLSDGGRLLLGGLARLLLLSGSLDDSGLGDLLGLLGRLLDLLNNGSRSRDRLLLGLTGSGLLLNDSRHFINAYVYL
jgi:hypothetical protein